MLSDKLLINLRILSKIQKNGKITRSYDGIITLDSETILQPIKRFLANDSRKQAVHEIRSIINECEDTFYNIVNSKYLHTQYYGSDEYIKALESLQLLNSELENASVGVENLKFTYSNDQTIVSQLDIMVLKLLRIVKDCAHKISLHSYQTTESYGFQPDTQTTENYIQPTEGENKHETVLMDGDV
jgi:hypothetical protein